MARATLPWALLIIMAVGLGACSGSASTPPLGTYALASDTTETLTLLDGGRFKHDIPLSDDHISGTWGPSQAELSFTETSGGGCINIPGTYSWSYDGTTLHLTQLVDPCFVLSGYEWVRRP